MGWFASRLSTEEGSTNSGQLRIAGQFSAWLIISEPGVIKLPICSFGNYPNKLAAIQWTSDIVRATVQTIARVEASSLNEPERGEKALHRQTSTDLNLFSFRALNTSIHTHVYRGTHPYVLDETIIRAYIPNLIANRQATIDI